MHVWSVCGLLWPIRVVSDVVKKAEGKALSESKSAYVAELKSACVHLLALSDQIQPVPDLSGPLSSVSEALLDLILDEDIFEKSSSATRVLFQSVR